MQILTVLSRCLNDKKLGSTVCVTLCISQQLHYLENFIQLVF